MSTATSDALTDALADLLLAIADARPADDVQDDEPPTDDTLAD